jgi:hypothetical protein
MKQIQFPSQVQKIETRTDGSIKLILETQELSGIDMAALFDYRNAIGYVTFTPNSVDQVSVPETNASYDGKSPGQRLRAVLYILWEQTAKDKYDTFEQFYQINMERIINQIKERLE